MVAVQAVVEDGFKPGTAKHRREAIEVERPHPEIVGAEVMDPGIEKEDPGIHSGQALNFRESSIFASFSMLPCYYKQD